LGIKRSANGDSLNLDYWLLDIGAKREERSEMPLPKEHRTAERRWRVVICVTYHIFVLLALFLLKWIGLISGFLIFAYLPVIARVVIGIFTNEERLNIRRIGFMELTHSIAFISLFVFFWEL
jgi:hypothetical protein